MRHLSGRRIVSQQNSENVYVCACVCACVCLNDPRQGAYGKEWEEALLCVCVCV